MCLSIYNKEEVDKIKNYSNIVSCSYYVYIDDEPFLPSHRNWNIKLLFCSYFTRLSINN